MSPAVLNEVSPDLGRPALSSLIFCTQIAFAERFGWRSARDVALWGKEAEQNKPVLVSVDGWGRHCCYLARVVMTAPDLGPLGASMTSECTTAGLPSKA